ncbi:F-box only protein 15 isoform X6 [Anser cygnoides]|uniref:F-box only protein 15 isoform X6 n=1 Tax=Anser cygnoides TaxID=8845 RepID=UPI0034D19B91
MAAVPGRAQRRWGRGMAAAAPLGAVGLAPPRLFAPFAAAAGLRNKSRSFAARPGECSETVNAEIKSLYRRPPIKPKPNMCIESMPSEMLMKIFSYLDAVSLLCVACVNKRFYHLANDKNSQVDLTCVIWLKIYSGCFPPKRTIWKTKSVQTETVSLSCAPIQDRKPGYWKKEYVLKQIAAITTRVMQLVKPVDPYTGLPSRIKKAIKPRRRSLIAEYDLSNLTESNVALGANKLVQLFSLNPGLLVGLWKGKNEIALVMASLHYHQLLERSTLGSATVPCVLPPNKPILDDVDPEYGLHDYDLHLDMHSGSCTYLCGTFKSLFCRKGDIENGYLRLTVVSLKDNAKHVPLIGTVGLSWETDAFKGNVKDCYVMDVTLLDETRKPFWCFSAPVCMELSSKASSLCDYTGCVYTTDYADSEGKVCVELVWLEETKEYFIVSLVLYVSTEKVNNWYGTNY